MKKITTLLLASAFSLSLSACSAFFDKDNTPNPSALVNFPTEARVQTLWQTSAGPGVGDEYLKLTPAISGNTVFAANLNGTVSAFDKMSGKFLWGSNTNTPLTGGVATDDHLVFVGTRTGKLIALQQTNGAPVWSAYTSSEILAPSASNNNVVLAKTIDGNVTAFSTLDGHKLWHYQQAEPGLILRGSSAPQLTRQSAIVGFENGILAKLSINDGNVLWQQAIATPEGSFAIRRMVDIDADPVIYGNRVFAATYQGRIAALELDSGRVIWSHDISSYAGIAVDGQQVYVSDAESHVWAFSANSGALDWQQKHLYARNITGPAIINNYIVVGDAEGYLHWLSKQDGHFVARTFVNKSGILATPIVNNNILYVYTKDGRLAAYMVG